MGEINVSKAEITKMIQGTQEINTPDKITNSDKNVDQNINKANIPRQFDKWKAPKTPTQGMYLNENINKITEQAPNKRSRSESSPEVIISKKRHILEYNNDSVITQQTIMDIFVSLDILGEFANTNANLSMENHITCLLKKLRTIYIKNLH